ncbi:MAG TPA: hypothetical protein VG267_05680 [Terracidiphilus sp.]|nr:hypothetical protein [Terracidiphilus sp.]
MAVSNQQRTILEKLTQESAATALPRGNDPSPSLAFEEALLTFASGLISADVIIAPGPAAAPAKITKKGAAEAVAALRARYACPLAFAGKAEKETYEEALRYLMVADRAQPPASAVAEELRWILLNLVALRVRIEPELRGLDALNFFWESLARPWPVTDLAWAFLANYHAALEAFA